MDDVVLDFQPRSAALADRPDDVQGHELLAGNEAQLGNFTAAHIAQAQVLAIKGADATAQDHANHADLLVLAAEGYVSPESEAALSKALALDPANGTALFYSGLMLGQIGRPDLAFNVWRDLLDRSRPGAPWVPAIRARINTAAMLAGVRYTLPPLAEPNANTGETGPADGMTREQYDGMIRGMVDGLSARLLADGGSAEDWARLITSHMVLNDADAALDALIKARAAFADDSAALALINAAATDAGISE